MKVAGEALDLKSTYWEGVDGYDEDSVFRRRATALLKRINWDAVCTKCSVERGTPARLSTKFSIGTHNLVRQIIFDDGRHWVARFRMPGIPGHDITTETVEESMQVEISALLFIKAFTTIPVPALHLYDHRIHNEFEAPYMIMDYINGLTADEMRVIKHCADSMFGSPEQDAAFRKRMAQIHAELASHAFSKIGRLFYQGSLNSDANTRRMHRKMFSIGADTETHKGPWTSSLDYYRDLADHALQLGLTKAWTEKQLLRQPSATLPLVFQKLIPHYCMSESGPFRLYNSDFGSHNVLVNDDFDILGVIDWDGLMSAPIEFVAQIPAIYGLSGGVPGAMTKPAVQERLQRADPLRFQYKRLLKDAEQYLQDETQHFRQAEAWPRSKLSEMRLSEEAIQNRWNQVMLDAPIDHLEQGAEEMRKLVYFDIKPSLLMFSEGAEIVSAFTRYRNYRPVKDELEYLLKLLAKRLDTKVPKDEAQSGIK